jgi:4-amino-4-deoxy-L-arabinose transferase-like glycosyltransferase
VPGAETRSGSDRAAWIAVGIAVAAFLGAAAADVGQLQHNYDEGVYVFQAREMAAGKLPMVDFFSHQPPLYPALLAVLELAGAGTLWGARFLSALCWCAAAVIVFRLARTYLGAGASALACFAVLLTPLGLYFGRVALPNAPMVALTVTAFLLAGRDGGRKRLVAAGVVITLAVLIKPLALAPAIALALWLALGRRWRALALLTVTGAVGAASAWLLLDLAGDGGFTELVRLQLTRFRHAQGFELVRQYGPFAQLTDARGIDTALAWNLAEHRRGLLSAGLPGADANVLTVVGAAAALLLWPWLATRQRRLVGLCVVWLGVPLAFNLLVWEPVWNHYFVQYIPPLALLVAVSAEALSRATSRWGETGRRAALLAVGALLVALALHVRPQLRLDPRALAPLEPVNSPWRWPCTCGPSCGWTRAPSRRSNP